VSRLDFSGRTWVFPEANIDTDLMMPGATFRLPFEEQVKLVFSANRPGWSSLVSPGDIVVGGPNFGAGSARPAPSLFKRLGVAALVAESFSDLFLRNCINYALPALTCPGICEAVTEGDVIDVSFEDGVARVHRTGQELRGVPMPKMLLDIVAAGGLMAQLRTLNYIA
jgi:3-isopropylmalate/(R)-2-methylmalate dehydratase small subunit